MLFFFFLRVKLKQSFFLNFFYSYVHTMFGSFLPPSLCWLLLLLLFGKRISLFGLVGLAHDPICASLFPHVVGTTGMHHSTQPFVETVKNFSSRLVSNCDSPDLCLSGARIADMSHHA
jgi:hypothetical protein